MPGKGCDDESHIDVMIPVNKNGEEREEEQFKNTWGIACRVKQL